MTTDPSLRSINSNASSRQPCRSWLIVCLAITLLGGCNRPADIQTYTIPTKVPEQLQPGKERMLAAMVPKGDSVWFFKVSGPEKAIDQIDETFRQFVEEIQFSPEMSPDLSSLPEGWRKGSNQNDAFRFASIDVETSTKQLDVSVSSLARQEDWDEQVKMNVNRWRGQLSLPSSESQWAEGMPIEIAAADPGAIWVDLIGEPGGAGGMTPPFAGSLSSASSRGDLEKDPASETASSAGDVGATASSRGDARLNFDRPEGWRDGRMSSMRWAAFDIGPEDASAELTVIPAGGDLRGNVARWLGQIRGGEVPASVVDQAMADAQQVEVDGRPSQRFFLTGEDPTKGEAIDATIVPLENGISLFIKMTGPAETVSQQADTVASFLRSLKLNL